MRRIFLLILAVLAFVPACIALRPGGDQTANSSPEVVSATENNRLPETVRSLLHEADKLEVQSLNPTGIDNWEILGRTTVTNRTTRQRILAAIERGIAASDGSAAACFRPRHGVRATHKGQTVELILCFECAQIKVRMNEKEQQTVLTAGSAQPVLDEILKSAGVNLAPKPGKSQ